MNETVRARLERDSRVAYAVVFGSRARGEARPDSDIDIGIGLMPGATLSARDMGALVADLEHDLDRVVDVVVLHWVPCTVSYRAFRDGRVVFERDHAVLTEHRTRAILEYLDWQPVETLFTQGVLEASSRGR